MTFLDKLNALMSEKNINRTELAKGSGVPYTTISSFYEKGTDNIKLSTLKRLSSYLGCSLDYLVDDTVTDKNPSCIRSEPEPEIIKKYRKLDEYGKKAVDSILSIEHERVQQAESKAAAEPRTRFIEMYYLPVSAGSGVYMDSNIRQKEMIEIPVNEKTAKANFILTVKGDSMEPKYSDGDKILIQSMPCVDYGQLGIFIVNDGVYFKKFGKEGLESLNPKYPIVKVNECDSFICKGKVIGKL
jgi:repressor LexA